MGDHNRITLKHVWSNYILFHIPFIQYRVASEIWWVSKNSQTADRVCTHKHISIENTQVLLGERSHISPLFLRSWTVTAHPKPHSHSDLSLPSPLVLLFSFLSLSSCDNTSLSSSLHPAPLFWSLTANSRCPRSPYKYRTRRWTGPYCQPHTAIAVFLWRRNTHPSHQNWCVQSPHEVQTSSVQTHKCLVKP